MGEPEKLTYTVMEAAKALQIGPEKVYELVARGDLPSIRLGKRRILIPVKSLEQWLETRATQPTRV